MCIRDRMRGGGGEWSVWSSAMITAHWDTITLAPPPIQNKTCTCFELYTEHTVIHDPWKEAACRQWFAWYSTLITVEVNSCLTRTEWLWVVRMEEGWMKTFLFTSEALPPQIPIKPFTYLVSHQTLLVCCWRPLPNFKLYKKVKELARLTPCLTVPPWSQGNYTMLLS